MRVLHPISQREKFVASGIYRYTRGGVPAQGNEHFSIHALPDGSWFVRVDYDWRLLDGSSQLIEALVDPLSSGGRFQRIVAQLHSSIGISRESFDFHGDHVLVGIGDVASTRRDIEVPLPPGYAVLMLKTTLAGIAASRWPAPSGQQVKAFGGYRTETGTAMTFDAMMRDLPSETLKAGSETVRTRVVELTGEFPQTLWLDSLGVPVRRVLGETAADLHSYARRPEQTV
jgi:hypothetical protein